MNKLVIIICIILILTIVLCYTIFITNSEYFENVENTLKKIQNKLKLDYGNFDMEVPEQIMAVKYIKGNEKVLEIGGNIGRNTMVIGYILNQNNNNNLVSLESDTDISKQLIHNKELNNLDFYIENAALSKRPLIQKEWNTIVSDEVLEGYKKVNTITYEELKNKYNIDFDTLVLDCEGAFYYILMDMPEILNNVNLIIMENDYHDIAHKKYIDNILKQNNFEIDYQAEGGWGPCANYFFQVWIKK
jgi:FkbM family methyltransferase